MNKKKRRRRRIDPETDPCPFAHCVAQVKRVLDLYGVEVERPVKDILQEVRWYDSLRVDHAIDDDTDDDDDDDGHRRRDPFLSGARPKRIGSLPSLLQEIHMSLPPSAKSNHCGRVL